MFYTACLPDVSSISINGKDEVICGNSVKFKAIVDQSVDQSLFPVWSITWQKRRGENIRCIDISDEKYSGSTNSKLLIRSACKRDEGEYSAFLSIESNGKKYKLESNTISLLVVGGMALFLIIKAIKKRFNQSWHESKHTHRLFWISSITLIAKHLLCKEESPVYASQHSTISIV